MGSRRLISFAALAGLLFACPLVSAQTYSIAGANSYVQRKDWNGLIAYTKAWTRSQPQEPLAWYYLGETYGIGLNRPQDALPAFQQAARLKSQWPELWNALGHVHAQLSQYRESADAFSRAAQQNPRRMTYWYNLASAYSDAGQWQLAKQALDGGERNAGPSASWVDWFNLGNGYLALRQFGSAAAAYNRSLRMNARYSVTWNNLGAALEQGGNSSGALRAYRQAAALGDSMGKGNLNQLQRAMQQAQQQPARRGYNPAAVIAGIREGQIKSYIVNHPEASYSQAQAATSH